MREEGSTEESAEGAAKGAAEGLDEGTAGEWFENSNEKLISCWKFKIGIRNNSFFTFQKVKFQEMRAGQLGGVN